MKLIEDWKQAWKFFSVQIAAVISLMGFAYDYLPAMQQYLPEGWVKWAALAIIAGRVIDQKITAK